MTRVSAPQVEVQGKIIAHSDEDAPGSWFLMFPDGVVRWYATRRQAEKEAKAWFAANLGAPERIGVGAIEWRS